MNEVNPEPMVEVDGVSKRYRRDVSLWGGLLAGLGRTEGPTGLSSDVTALDAVSFRVARGEAFGVIGRNGAGKSTLLQILAGTLQPSVGTCRVRGRVTALLELGSGFNPEFTGRENIFLAGAILGFSGEEMARRLDRITEFADIGEFIDRPVKTYSTGMMMRVAFAVAISVEPDVLIIDEALSVGDIVFQQKCSRRLQELVASGVTLLVVTHDLAFVLSMCRRAVWLDAGRVRYLGEAGDCVRAYVAAMAAISGNSGAAAPARMDKASLPLAPELGLAGKERLGDGGIAVSRAWLLRSGGQAGGAYQIGEWAEVVLLLAAGRAVQGVSGGIELRNRLGQVVFATGLRASGRLVERMSIGERCVVAIRFRLELQVGEYTLDVGCGAGGSEDNTWDRVLRAAVIGVSASPGAEVVHGLVRLPHEISVARVEGVVASG